MLYRKISSRNATKNTGGCISGINKCDNRFPALVAAPARVTFTLFAYCYCEKRFKTALIEFKFKIRSLLGLIFYSHFKNARES